MWRPDCSLGKMEEELQIGALCRRIMVRLVGYDFDGLLGLLSRRTPRDEW